MSEPMAEIVDLPTAEQRARAVRPRYGERALIVCDNLVKIYKVADLEVVALQGLDLLVESGEFIALVGASGSGKSTLLNILGGLDVPSAGRAVVAGHDLARHGIARADALPPPRHRLRLAADVAQPPAVPDRAGERRPADGPRRDVRGRTARRLRPRAARAGRPGRSGRPPARSRMSGGEQQRVAIAVALANRPEVLLADEPTGELDTATAHQIFDLFRRLNQDLGVTIVVATHDPLVSDQVDRTVAIRDGRVSSEVLRHRTLSAAGDHHVDRDGVRGARPRRAPPAAARARRGARARAAGPARARGRPHRGLAGSARPAIRTGRTTRRGRRPVTQPVRPARAPARRHARRAPRSMVETRGLGRDFLMGSTVVHALADVDLRVERGELVAIRGRSGLGQDDAPVVDRRARPADGRPGLRRRRVDRRDGPGRARRHPAAPDRLHLPGVRADLDPVRGRERRGPAPPGRRRPARARGAGEAPAGARRAWPTVPAIGRTSCRAASSSASRSHGRSPTAPSLLLADEPTGQLDSATGRAIMSLLRAIVHSERLTAIIATHDPHAHRPRRPGDRAARRPDRRRRRVDGRHRAPTEPGRRRSLG